MNTARISSTFPFDPDQSNDTASITVSVSGGGSALSSTDLSAIQPALAAAVFLVLGTCALLVAIRRRARVSTSQKS